MAILAVGTANNQIPTNADLGELAFQSKESVNFSNGRGGLQHLDITAISRQLNVSAVDIFVYDTSKDSDGGTWRNRCQHTSWYNQELNTSTRGSRREFPGVAVIVLLTGGFTIYDGDDPLLPMWLVSSTTSMTGFALAGATSICALNGIIVIGQNDTSGSNYDGLRLLDFVKDYGFWTWYVTSTTHYSGTIVNSVANTFGQRPQNYIRSGSLASAEIADVAIAVFPNAPIDSVTGLSIPTIAIATNGGISVLKDDGSVVSLNTLGSYSASQVIFTKNYLVGSRDGGASNYIPMLWKKTSLIESAYPDFIIIRENDSYPSSNVFKAISTGSQYQYAFGYDDKMAIGVANGSTDKYGLYIVDPNLSSTTSALSRFVNKSCNTGWMPGDTKGAWLNDTTQEIMIGTELITNGTFDSNTNGWSSPGTATLSVVSGAIRVTNISTNGRAQSTAFTTTPGKKYIVTATGVNRTSNTYYLEVRSGVESVDAWSSGSMQRTFVAVQSTTYIELYAIGEAGIYAEYDNVSVREADPDRSINNKGLQVFGNITKTPVATGADLVAYSGWSMSGVGGSGINYLRTPYPLNIGTSPFTFIFWIKATTDGNQQSIFGCNESDGDWAGPYLSLYTTGRIYLGMYLSNGSSPVQSQYDSGRIIADGQWHQVCIVKTGTKAKHYIDGIFDVEDNDLYETCAAFDIIQFGVGYRPLNGSLSLFRLSLAAPSDAQIAKMYNDEKHLFQENAKATIYGTSDAVTALTYDNDTNLLHVGTSSGRSVFNGLRRVDNTTTAVATSISAANGLVAEQ